MSKAKTKVIHVSLRDMYQGKTNYYFGSVKAIYAILPLEIVGVKEQAVRQKMYKTKSRVVSFKKCTITADYLHRSETPKRKGNIVNAILKKYSGQ